MKRYQQKYCKTWENDLMFKKWLRPGKDITKATCIYCNTQIAARHADLVRHSKTNKHTKTMEPFNNIDLTQKKISFVPESSTDKQKSQASLALFTAVHTPFVSMDHLSEVCCKVFGDSKGANIKLHRTKCANIITNILGPHFIEDLLEDLQDSYFSLILDEGKIHT